jgi:hypothetical protein
MTQRMESIRKSLLTIQTRGLHSNGMKFNRDVIANGAKQSLSASLRAVS